MAKLRLVPALFLVAFIAGGSLLGDDADTKIRGMLPPYWGKLGLSVEQKQQVYQTQAKYRAKIQDLERQMEELRKQEKVELEKVLTPAQKDRLRELILEKVPGGKSTPPAAPDKPE
ncbi:MAG: hypothetical protein ACK4RK_13960 [Gemmataceae bacterium]